jgi:iron(III) transport system substrate-binding protein
MDSMRHSLRSLGHLSWAGTLFLAVACSGPGGSTAGPREQDKVLQAESVTPEEAKYRDALKKFNDEVVPAAEKEGEMNWYACTEADEAQEMIDEFSKYYPKIRVNHVFGQGFTLVEKIAAESAANKITADSYICGITSARNLTNREGIGMVPDPPSALTPNVIWNWQPVEGNGLRPLWSTNGIAGITVNPNLVPKDKYPKTWWDLVRDPFWQEQLRKGNVGIADPRASGFGHQILYGLRVLKESEYGEAYIRQLAELKPKKLATNADEVPRGELAAYIGGSVTTKYRRENLPVELVCPDPGCVQSFLAPATVNGPHPNAAKVWAEFWLTKEGQQFLAEKQWRTIARTDIAVDPSIDWKNMKQLYFASEEHDKPTQAALEWNKQTRVWDY